MSEGVRRTEKKKVRDLERVKYRNRERGGGG